MEARRFRVALVALALSGLGASHRSENFVVTVVEGGSSRFAREVAEEAESLRRELAQRWLGKELPPWYHPCPIRVISGDHHGPEGRTSFVFNQGQVYDWDMEIRGSRERLLDSVLPHEVTHTIFASHFRRPLPRWADEGACTTVEHNAEKRKHQQMLIRFLKSQRGIPFNTMFAMTDYPPDIMPLYAQGFSVARYLIEQGGPRKFVRFLEDGLKGQNWGQAVDRHYGLASLGKLQTEWLAWVREGSPPLENALAGDVLPASTRPPTATMVAQAGDSPYVIRAQSADPVAAEEPPLVALPIRRPANVRYPVARRTRWSDGEETSPIPEVAMELNRKKNLAAETSGDTPRASVNRGAGPQAQEREALALQPPRQARVLLEWTRPGSENLASAARMKSGGESASSRNGLFGGLWNSRLATSASSFEATRMR